MGCEKIASIQSFKTKTFLLKVHILLVDDDSTSLSIVSTMLKTCSKQDRMIELSVVTVKSPRDALTTLRIERDVFDLVVTDLHMPEMNGIQLQKQVEEEFKLPVIIMSSDDNESLILQSLEGGAVFYIVKPVNPTDLKNVWQYAVAAKKGKSSGIKETENPQLASSLVEKICFGKANSASSVNEERIGKKDTNNRGKKRTKEEQEDDNPVAIKKAKVVWTNSLHNRFLQAINHIGLDKAVPKKILEFMNVPGLSRENVASHLQKYRIFLKRVADKSANSFKNLSERDLRSNFVAGHQSSLMQKNGQQEYSPFSGQQQMRTSLQPAGYGGLSYNPFGFPNQQAPGGNSEPRFLYGQPGRPFGDFQASFRRPLFGTPPPFYHLNRTNMCPLPHGGMAFGLANAVNGGFGNGTSTRNPMQMYHQQEENQSRSILQKLCGNGLNHGFFSAGIQGPNRGPGMGNMGAINSPYPTLNASNNYAGIRMSSDGKLFGTQISSTRANEFSNGINCGTGLMHWLRNDNVNMTMNMNMNGPPMLQNKAFGHHMGPDVSSPAGYETANQFAPPFTGINNHENAAMLPPMNNSSIFDSMSTNQQHLGTNNLVEIPFEPINNLVTPHKQNGWEVNNPFYELLNPDFLASCHLQENAPWTEQPSSQFQGGEVMNQNYGNNANAVDEYFPTSGQQQGQGNLADSMFNDMMLDVNATGNQEWDDEFMNSLFGNDSILRE